MSGPETLAYVCSHVFGRTRPVLLVARDDGDWQFLCGGTHEPDEVPRVVGMNHLTDDDPSILQVVDLPVNWEAERKSPRDEWVRACSIPEQK